jgi:copper homeostasis protein
LHKTLTLGNKKLLEICVSSIEAALAAQRGGADRVELCENLPEGGTTPSAGTLAVARKLLNIGIHAMIRPRGGDFLYSSEEFEVMKKDVVAAKASGADGVVFGLLTADGKVDEVRTCELVQLASPMHAAFHRAFDTAADPFAALESIIACGAKTLLTSGQQEKAEQGKSLIKELVKLAAGRIDILVGSGVNENNIATLAQETGATSFHLSARIPSVSGMHYLRKSDNGKDIVGAFEYMTVDENTVHKIKSLLDAL